MSIVLARFLFFGLTSYMMFFLPLIKGKCQSWINLPKKKLNFKPLNSFLGLFFWLICLSLNSKSLKSVSNADKEIESLYQILKVFWLF